MRNILITPYLIWIILTNKLYNAVGRKEVSYELEDHPQPYDLGESEFHLAFEVDDYDAAHKLHEEIGCICFENPAMGIYFITDPDGYWLEIIPAKKM